MRALTLAAMLVAAPLSATELQFSVRGGYSAIKGLMSFGVADDFDALVPLAVEAGYRPRPDIYLGLFLEYSAGVPACPLTEIPDCSGHGAGFGGQARYSFSPEKPIHPFIGASLGCQRLLVFATEEEFGRFTARYSEIQVGVEIGLELRAARQLVIAPYAAGRISGTITGSLTQDGKTVDTKSGGSFVTAEIGLRLSFSP